MATLKFIIYLEFKSMSFYRLSCFNDKKKRTLSYMKLTGIKGEKEKNIQNHVVTHEPHWCYSNQFRIGGNRCRRTHIIWCWKSKELTRPKCFGPTLCTDFVWTKKFRDHEIFDIWATHFVDIFTFQPSKFGTDDWVIFFFLIWIDVY